LADSRLVSFVTPDELVNRRIKCDIYTSNMKPLQFRALNAFRNKLNFGYVIAQQSGLGNATCVTQHVCTEALEVADEFGSYRDLRNTGTGYSVARGKTYRPLRAALKPSTFVRQYAEEILARTGSRFNAIHVRRSDFRTKDVPGVRDEYGREAIYQSLTYIVKRVKGLQDPALPLFVASEDGSWVRKRLRPAISGLNIVHSSEVDVPRDMKKHLGEIDIKMFAEQIVCSYAGEFIGNRVSTMTSEIVNERLLRNSSSTISFW
jgi:GDP-fucose protein O-fucosyltransferase